MFSRFFLLVTGIACAVGLDAKTRVGASPVSVKFGGAVRWSHAHVRVKSTSTISGRAGLLMSDHAFNRSNQFWEVDDHAGPIPTPGSFIGMFNGPRAFGEQHVGNANANAYSVYFITVTNDAGDNQRVGADLGAVFTKHQNNTMSFLRSLKPGTGYRYSLAGIGLDAAGAVDAGGVLAEPVDLSTPESRAKWMFGEHPVNGGVIDGVLSPVAERSIQTGFTHEADLDRPAIDFLLRIDFALNENVTMFVDGGYSIVFGKSVTKEEFNLDVGSGPDEQVSTVLGKDYTVSGGFGRMLFQSSGGRVFSGVKSELSVKEGWKAFAGFSYAPIHSLFVSCAVGLKEYKVQMDVTRKTFAYPYSPLYRTLYKFDPSGYQLAPEVKIRYERNLYPLTFKVEFGAVISGKHVFSAGVEYASTKADLYVSSKDVDAAFDSPSKAKVTDVTVYKERFELPYDALANRGILDFMDGPSMHMTDLEDVTIKHAAQVFINDISFAVDYKFKA